MDDAQVFVGVDVSQETLEVAVRPGSEHWQQPNDSTGVRQLVKRLTQLPGPLVCHFQDYVALFLQRLPA